MKKQKDKTYAFRVSSSELKKIKSQAKQAKLTVTDYLTARLQISLKRSK